MAGNMDPNELQAVSDALEELRKSGNLSAESLAKLNGNSATVSKALEGYTRSLLGGASAIGGMAKTVAQGEGSFASLGTTISGLTGIVGKLASVMPLVGGAAKALAEGVGDAAKFVLDQLDTMSTNYRNLGDASATAADGVDGLQRQFKAMGNYSLPAFTRAVKANTTGLAALGGTAADGADRLSELAGNLTTGKLGERFLKMGMSLDAVGDAAAAYASDSARYGLTQGDLTKRTQNYIIEVDKIARLTGQTREAQQREAQKSLANVQFRAKLDEMRANNQGAQAEQLRLYVEGLGGAAGDAARALVTGIPLTKEAAAANLFANDAIRQNTQAIIAGKDATTAIAETMQAAADGTNRFGKQLQFTSGAFDGIALQGFEFKAIIAEQNKLMREGMTREQAIAAVQKRQAEAAGDTTKAFVAAQMAVADSSKNIQKLGFDLATAAIPAVNKFAESLKKVTDFVYDKIGGSRPATEPAVPPPPRKPDVAPVIEDWRRRQLDKQLPSGSNKEFIDKMYKNLLDEAIKQGVKNPEVIARLGTAQSALETGYGKHTAGSQNYFGIKARPGEGGSGVATQEFINGKMVTVNDKFRKYGSMQESAADYIKFLQENKRYKDVLNSSTLEEAIAAQSKTGYATDPNYGAKLRGIAGKVSGSTERYSSTNQANITPKDPTTAIAGSTEKYQKTLDLLSQQLTGQADYSKNDSATAVLTPKDLKAAIAGPIEKYQSSMSGVNPAAAGVETATSAQKITDTQQQNQDLSAIARSSAEQTELLRQQNDILRKDLKYNQLR
jgi:flagellum-specific peptidoglycan hydrolase FlgJ